MIETPARRPRRRRDRRGRRLLLVRNERPHPDDVRLQPRRRRGPDDVRLPREGPARAPTRSRTSTREGVGELVRDRRREGTGDEAGPEVRRLRRARRRPQLDRHLLQGRSRLRQLLAIPRPDRSARGGPVRPGSGAGSLIDSLLVGAPQCRGDPLRRYRRPAWPFPMKTSRRSGRSTDIVALIGEYTPLSASGAARRALPVPRGEVGLVQRERRGGPLLLLRLPGVGRRHHASCGPSRGATSSRRSSGWRPAPASRPQRRRRPATGQRPRRAGGARRGHGRAVDFYHERLLKGADAGQARQYLRSRGLRRRRRAAASASAGRRTAATNSYGRRSALGRSSLAGRARRRGQLRPAETLPGPGDLPDLRPVGQGHRPRRPASFPASADGAAAEVPQLHRDPHLLQTPHPLRAQLGAPGDRAGRRDHRLRGLHRRHRPLPRRLPRAVATCGTALTDEHFRCSPVSGGGSCSASTPTRPASRPPHVSMSGSAGTSSRWPWRTLPAGSDPGELARDDPDAVRAAIETCADLPRASGSRRAARRRDLRDPEACPRGRGRDRR